MELESEICNFADDTTIYACDTDVEAVMIRLEGDLQGLMQWFNPIVVGLFDSPILVGGGKKAPLPNS